MAPAHPYPLYATAPSRGLSSRDQYSYTYYEKIDVVLLYRMHYSYRCLAVSAHPRALGCVFIDCLPIALQEQSQRPQSARKKMSTEYLGLHGYALLGKSIASHHLLYCLLLRTFSNYPWPSVAAPFALYSTPSPPPAQLFSHLEHLAHTQISAPTQTSHCENIRLTHQAIHSSKNGERNSSQG